MFINVFIVYFFAIFAELILTSLHFTDPPNEYSGDTFSGGKRNKRNANPIKKQHGKNATKINHGLFYHVFSFYIPE